MVREEKERVLLMEMVSGWRIPWSNRGGDGRDMHFVGEGGVAVRGALVCNR